MRISKRSPNPMPTLHAVWRRTIVNLIVVIVALGAIAVAVTQYQRTAFERTTSQVNDEMGVIVTLDRALLKVDDPMGAVLYKFGGASRAESSLRTYREASATIGHAFHEAEVTVSSGEGHQLLLQAHASWNQADAAVVEGAAMPADALNQSLAEGKDPFQATVWAPLRTTNATLTQVRGDTLAALRQSVAHVNGMQRLTGPLVVAMFLLALGLAWLSSRRIALRVLDPLASLGRAAAAVHGMDSEDPLVFEGAVAEVRGLADILSTTAAAVRSSQSMLRDQANSDTLTGLPNRKAFTEHLTARLAEPNHGPVAALFIDLDDFKIVNDSLGHAAGDELLRIVSRRLRGATRGCEMVARLGGDEFAVILDVGDQPAATVTAAERILAALEQSATIDGTQVSVGCSIGIAVTEDAAGVDAADELLRNADFAMYMAKSQGKNRFEVFAPRMHSEMIATMELKHDLSQALRQDEFVLFYQPIVAIGSGDLLGFEALVRWKHPLRGLLLPAEFISIAEDTGDIVDIGAWVIDQSCRDLASRHLASPANPTPWVSVNVSARQLRTSEFVDTVRDALDAHGIAPGSLILEITEGAAMTNVIVASRALSELRALGVRVALDDFGTGFSSLKALDELPVDIVKIDRSFVTADGNDNTAMLEAIVLLGRSLGLELIAEGIEQPSELQRLRTLGVPCGQGYLFARPMPAADATRYQGEVDQKASADEQLTRN